MPHIVVEYSENLNTPMRESEVLKALFHTVVDSGLFAPEAVKARAMPYAQYQLPDGGDRFAHITVSILAGRTEQQRAGLSQAVFEAAMAKLPSDVKLSVNIHEMCKETYKK